MILSDSQNVILISYFDPELIKDFVAFNKFSEKKEEEPRVPDPDHTKEMSSESSPSTEDRLSECPKVDVSEESTETKSGDSSPEMLPSPSQASEETLKVKDKGDMVYVASADRNTPSSDSTNKGTQNNGRLQGAEVS